MKVPPILTVTLNPALDITTRTERLEPVRKLRCSAPRYDAGGGGVNVSRAIAELGGESRAFAVLGGPIGDQYADLLREAGLDTILHRIAEASRFSLTVMETATNQHFRFVLPGPQIEVAETARIEAALAAAISAGPSYIVLSGSLPPGLPADFYGRISGHARKAGAKVILDTSGPALTAALPSRPYCVRINHHEARDLVGGTTEEAVEAIARRLVDKGHAEVAIVTEGDQGAVLATADRTLRVAPPKVTVQSTVGAGDSFVAALTLGLARDWPLETAVRYGVASAAAAVMTQATQLCQREDVERLFAAMA